MLPFAAILFDFTKVNQKYEIRNICRLYFESNILDFNF